jgi:hypothetical protein
VAQHQKYPITSYQPTYFVAESLVSTRGRLGILGGGGCRGFFFFWVVVVVVVGEGLLCVCVVLGGWGGCCWPLTPNSSLADHGVGFDQPPPSSSSNYGSWTQRNA